MIAINALSPRSGEWIPVAGILIKSTTLLALGAAATVPLRGSSAAVRHFVWKLTLAAIVLLALGALAMPAWRIEVPGLPPARPARSASAQPRIVPEDPMPITQAEPPAATRPARSSRGAAEPLAMPGVLFDVWALGALFVAGWALLGHVGLARLLRRAEPLASPEWESSLHAIALSEGIQPRVRLFRSRDVGSPVTWGWRRPVIVLPSGAESWSETRRRVVLIHELAHVVRGDALSQLVGLSACALYWFHPFAWLAARRLKLECEHACDDRVLGFGTPGGDYATHLLELAQRSCNLRLAGFVSIGMATRSHLEGRLLAVLDGARRRGSPGFPGRIAGWLAAALLALPLASLQPVGRALAQDSRDDAPTRSSSDFERSVEASPGGTLLLDLESGATVRVEGWDESRVHVQGQLSGRDWRDTRVELERRSDGARLHVYQDGGPDSWSTGHSFDIQVPRRFDVVLQSSGGSLSLSNLRGDFSGHTGGGAIHLDHLSGRAAINTGGGEIVVEDSDLSGSVATGGGRVNLTRVHGPLSASSGSGPVIRIGSSGPGEGDDSTRPDGDATRVGDGSDADAGGNSNGDESGSAGDDRPVHIWKPGGDVEIERAPLGASVLTGGGRIHIGESAGDVSATTGGGDIEIGPTSGSVVAATGAGDVRITLADGDGRSHSVGVGTGNGNVTLVLPADLAARFDLETAYTDHFGRRTRIDSDWSLDRSETDVWDDSNGTPRRYVRARGEVNGGGPLIRVKCVNGDIVVRRQR